MNAKDNDMQVNFDNVMDDFTSEVCRFFNNKQAEVAKDVKGASELCESLFTDDDHNIPLNVYLNADGSKTWVLAVPGKTKEDVSIVQDYKDGRRVINVTVKAKELSDEEKKAVEGRTVIFTKIKGMNGMKFSAVLPPEYDADSLKAKVENGLLSISVSKYPSEQPRVFTVE